MESRRRRIQERISVSILYLLYQGDTVESIRRRIQERISVSDKEWEKYRLAVVLNMKPLYFEENENKHLDIKVN